MNEAFQQLVAALDKLSGSARTSLCGPHVPFALEIAIAEGRRLRAKLRTALEGCAEGLTYCDLERLCKSFVRNADGPINLMITTCESAWASLGDDAKTEAHSLVRMLCESAPRPYGEVTIYAGDYFSPVSKAKLFGIALDATTAGLASRVVLQSAQIASKDAFKLTLADQSRSLSFCPNLVDQHCALWQVEIQPTLSSEDTTSKSAAHVTYEVLKVVPAKCAPQVYEEEKDTAFRASIVDLFGDQICLRDLQPRTQRVRNLNALRDTLSLPSRFVPRKNEAAYARVLQYFANDLVPRQSGIVYVGDTVLNDGTAIQNLSALAGVPVLGFLCNEKGFSADSEFLLGPVYFARHWSSLIEFARAALRRGLGLGPDTVAFFDLDQTVYAAKGRDDEPLRDARWEAILAFLTDILPKQRFEQSRLEAIYRHFDSDSYHFITRDNMDYVVLLVLSVASGLCDVQEIEILTGEGKAGIAQITQLLHQRAIAAQSGAENADRLLGVIRAVHYNTVASDQTPCKEFREYECRHTAFRMRKSSLADGAIVLNREVLDFIAFLRERGVNVFAVSDRPTEAAVIEAEDRPPEDLMSIPMSASGTRILEILRSIDLYERN